MDSLGSSEECNTSEEEEMPMPILSPPQDLNTVRRDYAEAELQPPPLQIVAPIEPGRRSRRRKSIGVSTMKRKPTLFSCIDEFSSSGSGFELSDVDVSTTAVDDSSARTSELDKTPAESKVQPSSMVDALNAAFVGEIDEDFPDDLTEVVDIGLPIVDKENRTFLYPSVSPESSYDGSSYILEALEAGNGISLADLDLNFDVDEYTVATANDGLNTNEDEAFDALALELEGGFDFAHGPSTPSPSSRALPVGPMLPNTSSSSSHGIIRKNIPPIPTAMPKPSSCTSGTSVKVVSPSIHSEVMRRPAIVTPSSSATSNRVAVEKADSSAQSEQETVDSKKESPESARRKKIRREELDCTLGSYWKIDDVPKGDDWSIRPKRPNAGAKLKALTLNELQNSRKIDHETRQMEETQKEDISPTRPKRANAGAKMKAIIFNESPSSRKSYHEERTPAPEAVPPPSSTPDFQKKSPYRVLPYERPVTRGKRACEDGEDPPKKPTLTKRQLISKAYLREKSGRYKARSSYTATGQYEKNSSEGSGSTKIDDFAVISLDKAVKTALLIPDTFSALPHDLFAEKMEIELEAERKQKELEIAAAIEKAHRINQINQTRTYRGMRDSSVEPDDYANEPGAFQPERSHHRSTRVSNCRSKFTSRPLNTSIHHTSKAAHSNTFLDPMKPKNKVPKMSKARQAILKQFEAYEQMTAGKQNAASVTNISYKRPLEGAMLPSSKKFATTAQHQNSEIPLRGRPPTKHMTRRVSQSDRLPPVAVTREPESFVSKRPTGPVRVPVKMRSSWTVTKPWEEDVEPKVIKLGNNSMLINEQLVRINYTKYVKEADVQLKYDPEARVKIEDTNPTKPVCGFDYCKLGCICSTLSSPSIVREHCGKPRCFFECICSQKFKGNPTLTESGDIRSRLRPRVSLFNWKNITRPGEARDSDEEPRKVRRVVVKKGSQGFKVPDGSPIKRPLPSHLRPVDWKERRLQEIERRKTTGETERAQVKPSPADSTSETTEITAIGLQPRSPHKPSHVYPSIPDFGLAQCIFDPPNSSSFKPGVSARYQYNYSLLRRTHGCRPCLVKLVSAPLHLSLEEIESACAPVNQRKPQNLTEEIDRLGWITRPFQKPTPSSIRYPADRQSFICGPSGEFMGLVEWSKLRNEFPSSRKVRIGSDGGMIVVVTLPVVEEKMAWIVFQVTQSALNQKSILLTEVGITLESKTFVEQQLSVVDDQITRKVLESISSDEYTRSIGGLFLLPDLPDYLIYGPHPVVEEEGSRILIGHSSGMKQKAEEPKRKERKESDYLGTGALVSSEDMENQLDNFIIEFVPFGSLDKLMKNTSSSNCVRVTG